MIALSTAWILVSVVGSPQAAPASDPEARLRALFEREWEQRLVEDPLLATSVGRREGLDRLPSVAPADLERRAAFTREVLDELATIDRDALGREARIDLAVFERQLRDRLAEHGFGAWQIPITADEGFHIDFARLPDEVPLRTVADHEAYLARLRAFPRYVAQQVANMRTGLERGMTLAAVVLEGYDVTIATHVVDDPRESLFYAPFEHLPAGIAAEERARLVREGLEAVEQGAVAGYREFLRFFEQEYAPRARETLGCSELPDGRAYYAWLVRHYTTLDLTPEDVHTLGLGEVARIRAEMEAVIGELGFEGSFEEFLVFLRTDPRFYPKTPHELLAEASWICKRMDAALPSLFGTLPRLPYGVEPVPAHLAPKYTAGRYVPPAEGTTEPGIYWVNTHALESRPLYALPALSLHEAVPGHHLQGQIARERTDQPPFRRYSYISAYGEGWGLYSEWLGVEAGMYDDPYDEFGRLTYEMWRACRLVVDTGLHAMGWTRERAMAYMASNTALSLHEVRTETDRYIAWPGQALAYKIGELEIRALRAEAEAALGADFDVRRFHDAVLATGSVPLPVLRSEIERFIEGERAALEFVLLESDAYGCGAQEGLGCGLALMPVLEALDDVDGVAGSAASWDGRVFRLGLAPGADAERIAATAAARLEGETRRLASALEIPGGEPDTWFDATGTRALSRHEAGVIATKLGGAIAGEARLDAEAAERLTQALRESLEKAFERAHDAGGGVHRLWEELSQGRADFERRLDFLTPDRRAAAAAILERELEGQ